MIDETNMDSCLLEPSVRLRFRTWGLLFQHLEKHVYNEEEKWGKLEGFSTEEIRQAKNGDNDMKQRLATKYQEFLSEKVVECCQEHRDHRHLLRISQIPEGMLAMMPNYQNQEPEQIVKCWGILDNLVVIASSIVRNGAFAPYILKTGYRTYPKLKKKTWLKAMLSREEEVSDFFDGKKQRLIADHMEQNIQKNSKIEA